MMSQRKKIHYSFIYVRRKEIHPSVSLQFKEISKFLSHVAGPQQCTCFDVVNKKNVLSISGERVFIMKKAAFLLKQYFGVTTSNCEYSGSK